MSKPTPSGNSVTQVRLPRVIFGSSAMGNLFEAPTAEQKLAIARAWLDSGDGEGQAGAPIVIDSAGKYGAGLALECIGENLRRLEVDPATVLISNKLGWYRIPLTSPEPTFEPGAWVDIQHDAEQRISRQGILDCWEQGCELLGAPYLPQLVSVHDPDEFLASAEDPDEREFRKTQLFDAYESLRELKANGGVLAVGVGSKDWRIAKELTDQIDLDWVMIANSLTIYRHPPELLGWIESLIARGVTVINSAVFNAGFLLGGKYFDYRIPSPKSDEGQKLFAWRETFLSLCERHAVNPAAVCVQFGLSPPAIETVAMNSTDPKRIPEFIALATTTIPPKFWDDAREAELIDAKYPYVPGEA